MKSQALFKIIFFYFVVYAFAHVIQMYSVGENCDLQRLTKPTGVYSHIGECQSRGSLVQRYWLNQHPKKQEHALPVASTLLRIIKYSSWVFLPEFHRQIFDSVFIGIVNCLVLAFLLYRLSLVMGFGFGALLAWFTFDLGNLRWLNSFFQENYSFLFLMLLVFSLFYYSMKEKKLWIPLGLSLCLSTLKTQHFLIFLTFALVLSFSALIQRPQDFFARKSFYLKILGGAVVLSILLNYLHVERMSPDDPNYTMNVVNKYQTIFIGLAQDHPDVDGLFKRLGIPLDRKPLIGTSFYTPKVWDDKSLLAQTQKVSKFTIFKEYLSTPSLWPILFRNIAKASEDVNVYYLKQLPSDPFNIPQYDLSHERKIFPLWHNLKKALWSLSDEFMLCLTLLCIVIGMTLSYRRPMTALNGSLRFDGFLILLVLLSIYFYEALACVVGDGYSDFSKHLTLAKQALDLGFLLSLYFIGVRLRGSVISSGVERSGSSCVVQLSNSETPRLRSG